MTRFFPFFSKLGNDYESIGGTRLRLQSLIMGYGILTPQANSLDKFTDVSVLNEVCGMDMATSTPLISMKRTRLILKPLRASRI